MGLSVFYFPAPPWRRVGLKGRNAGLKGLPSTLLFDVGFPPFCGYIFSAVFKNVLIQTEVISGHVVDSFYRLPLGKEYLRPANVEGHFSYVGRSGALAPSELFRFVPVGQRSCSGVPKGT